MLVVVISAHLQLKIAATTVLMAGLAIGTSRIVNQCGPVTAYVSDVLLGRAAALSPRNVNS